MVVLGLVEPDVELAAEHVDRLLAVVGVRAAAATARGDAEDVDLEHRVGKRDQVLDLDAVEAAQPAPLGAAHQLRPRSAGGRCAEEFEQRAAVRGRDALEQRHRRLGQASLHEAQVRRRDAGALRGAAQRQAALGARRAQALADDGVLGHGLAGDERLQRRGRKAAREQGAHVAQSRDVLGRVATMAAAGAHAGGPAPCVPTP